MPTTQAKKIGGAALAVALLATVMSAAIGPAAAASGDCSSEDTLSFGQRETGSLDRASGDTEDKWVVDVPQLSNPDEARLDIDEDLSDPLVYDFYEKDPSCKAITTDGEVIKDFEERNQPDNQKYWIHVELDDDSNVGDYSLLMEQES